MPARPGSLANDAGHFRIGVHISWQGAIMVSTFGCNNGLILAGSRLLYAMSLDGLFFRNSAAARQLPRARLGIDDSRNLGRLPDSAPDDQGTQFRRDAQSVWEPVWQPPRLRHFGGADLLHPYRAGNLPTPKNSASTRKGRIEPSAIRSCRCFILLVRA